MVDITHVLGPLFAAAGQRSRVERYLLAIITPLLAFEITTFFIHTFTDPFFVVYSLAVVWTSILGGTKPGLVATLFSALLNCFLVPPAYTLRLADADQVVKIVVFAVVGGVTALLIGTGGELQRRLDAERRRLKVTLKSIGDAVIATDLQGRVTFINAAAEQATGWNAAEAEGRMLHEVFTIVNEQTRVNVESPAEKVLRMGQVVGSANHSLLIRSDGSEIPIDDSAAPIFSAGVLIGVVLVFRDVTEARLTQATLLQSEKLAGVGRLATTIAHEINNPLEAVGNLLYLIRASDDLGTSKGFAKTAEQELARAVHVSRQTLSFARNSGTQEAVPVVELVNSIAMVYRQKLAAKRLTLGRRNRGDGLALAVKHDLGQVFSNLLSNAIDAERDGGCIEIRVSTTRMGRGIRLTVADRGCGISPRQLMRLYQPFFTTKADVGTGLGLWLTKKIVDNAGASMRVRSRLDRGTVFSVCWPATASAELQERPRTSQSSCLLSPLSDRVTARTCEMRWPIGGNR